MQLPADIAARRILAALAIVDEATSRALPPPAGIMRIARSAAESLIPDQMAPLLAANANLPSGKLLRLRIVR